MRPQPIASGVEVPTLSKTAVQTSGRGLWAGWLAVGMAFALGTLSSTAAWSIEVTAGPRLIMNPTGLVPLAGIVLFTTDIPARTTLVISNGQNSWTREFAEYQTEHYLPVLGLKPDSHYTVEVTVTSESHDSLVLSPLLHAVTNPLPADFPNISILASDPARMEPGYTLLDKFVRAHPNTPPGTVPDGTLPEYSIILDNAGEVVWYAKFGSRGMRQLPNGNLFSGGDTASLEVDMLGYIRNFVNFESNTLHHDLSPTASGTTLSLARESVAVDGYPTSYTDPNAPTQSTVIEDNPVVEFSPDGTLLNKWNLSDLLDPVRIAYYSLAPMPNGDLDWAHANAVLEDPRDDSILVSVRHQDAIIKFSRSTGLLKWILGNHNNWPPHLQPLLLEPAGTPFEWHYHPHAPMVTPSGTLLLFDNGNFRASPFDGQEPVPDENNYSRVVEYEIDEQSREIRQVWEYGKHADQRYFAPSVGDADWMKSTGNVLITYGNMKFVDGTSSDALGMGASHIRVVEVDHGTPADKLFEAVIFNTTPGSVVASYRSERIPDLYPLDTDKDGVPDFRDNCVLRPNGALIPDRGGNTQLDTNGDGFGNLCDADLNNDGMTNSLDLGLFRQAFLTNSTQPRFNPDADLNGDSRVNFLDLALFRTLFLLPPGPSSSVP